MTGINAYILAAGSSSRLGQPKQLILFKGVSLVEHLFHVINDLDVVKTYIILGAYAEEIKKKINVPKEALILNENWQNGMSSSIHVGVNHAMQQSCQGLMLFTCDQPFIDKDLIYQMIVRFDDSNHGIVASEYGEQFGPPIIFPMNFASELLTISGDRGAKQIVKKYRDKTRFVSFPMGSIDIDEPIDLIKLRKFNL